MKHLLRYQRRKSLPIFFTSVFLSLISTVAGNAQILRLSSTSSASKTDNAVIEVSLESPPEKGVTAIQWQTTIEGAGEALSLVQDVPPSAANASPSGKSIRCAPKSTTPKAQTFICMLVGGVDAIPDGKIARIQLSGPIKESLRVRIDNAVGVDKDLRRISYKPAELVMPLTR